MIRRVKTEDAPYISGIYNYYIQNTTVTFEKTNVSDDEMKERIERISSKFPYIVYEHDGCVAGYAYATEWKTRAAYRNSVEVTVYLEHGFEGKGIGKLLYMQLLQQLKQNGFHAIIGGIALPNEASIALHEKCGFVKIAHFKEVGYKFEKWIDVGYWQLIINQ